VFGARAAIAMAGLSESDAKGEIPRSEVFPALTETHLRSITWEHCGISRNEEGLQKAVSILRSVPMERRAEATRLDYELRSMRRVGLLIAQAALERRESRGGHYRSDYPEKAAEAVHSRLVRTP
jgi:L-aspartate oxidase